MRRPDGVVSLLSLQSIPTTRNPKDLSAAARRAQPQKTSMAVGLVVTVKEGVVVVDGEDGNNFDEDVFALTTGEQLLKAFKTGSVNFISGPISTVASESLSDISMVGSRSPTKSPALADFGPGLIRLQSLTLVVEDTVAESGVLAKDEEDANDDKGSKLIEEGL